jgi:glycosyltransferase involved in cell wall biosynthesis
LRTSAVASQIAQPLELYNLGRMVTRKTVALLASLPESLINFRGPLIELLRARGHRVIACAPHAPRQVLESLATWDVPFHPVDLQRNKIAVVGDLRYTWRIRIWLRRAKPDILLAYTPKPVIYGLIAGRLSRVPKRCALITGLGYAFTGQSLKKRLLAAIMARLYRIALKDCACAIFQNPDDLELFRRRRILPPGLRTLVVNGSGVDLLRFVPRQMPQGPVFLLIARLLKDKGIREYVEAARVVKATYAEARFQLAGWHDTNPEAIDRADLDRWVGEGVVEYLGPLEDVRSALAAARIYVLPSYREGTPRTVLEAMATGRPVITTDAPGCRDAVQHGVNGLLVPVGNVPQLAAAMIQMIRHPELAEAFGRAGLRIARERYDARIVSEAMADAMEFEG